MTGAAPPLLIRIETALGRVIRVVAIAAGFAKLTFERV